MKWQFQTIGWGMVALLASCAGNNQTTTSEPSQPTEQPAQTQSFPDPVTQPKASGNLAAVPGLLQSTNAKQRLPLINTGRSDPFSVVNAPSLPLPPNSRASAVSRRSAATSTLPPLPPISLSPLPPIAPGALPTVSLNSQSGSTLLPPGARPVPVSRTSLAEATEITGAIQIQGKWNVIVKEPGAATSRYVKAGDYLANGQVLVKRIIAGSGDPRVILQQNGVEVMKSLGSPVGSLAKK